MLLQLCLFFKSETKNLTVFSSMPSAEQIKALLFHLGGKQARYPRFNSTHLTQSQNQVTLREHSDVLPNSEPSEYTDHSYVLVFKSNMSIL